jgi:hypothetical protein
MNWLAFPAPHAGADATRASSYSNSDRKIANLILQTGFFSDPEIKLEPFASKLDVASSSLVSRSSSPS